MNENYKENKSSNNSEEIDLVVIFSLIGKGINNIISFIKSIFKSILTVIVYTLRAFIVNFKIIILTMILAGVLGYVLDKLKPESYASTMLVKPYFESKYQLITNINYFNALIENENYNTLSSLFVLSEDEVKDIKEFDIKPGPETENERILQFENFIKNVDSIRAKDINYDDFVENRSIYSSDFFEISVTALKKDIFPKLEEGLNNSFTNIYSLKKMKKRDSLIAIQKANIIDQIAQVDSLQKIYITVLKDESQQKPTEFSLGGEGFSLSSDKTKTREYDLLNTEMKLRNDLKQLEEKKIEEDVFFDVISSFQEVGNKSSEWYEKYTLIFPILAFMLLCVVYFSRITIVYVKNYEA
ncbi:hypothetical protein [Xanthomarina sp. F2636L]|uniref:hypothetical protein n=1 Tax=Xanthomarina sp. F2636L TaxID=2996018 RepID=UPI00225DF084|nr:hypothetical protein [Xanthomarina sp. F2636L]MCX7551317.1 hypothetical protein [Xanthomarina sp. F2636L]